MLFASAALHGPETLVSKPMTYLSIINGRRLGGLDRREHGLTLERAGAGCGAHLGGCVVAPPPWRPRDNTRAGFSW